MPGKTSTVCKRTKKFLKLCYALIKVRTQAMIVVIGKHALQTTRQLRSLYDEEILYMETYQEKHIALNYRNVTSKTDLWREEICTKLQV